MTKKSYIAKAKKDYTLKNGKIAVIKNSHARIPLEKVNETLKNGTFEFQYDVDGKKGKAVVECSVLLKTVKYEEVTKPINAKKNGAGN